MAKTFDTITDEPLIPVRQKASKVKAEKDSGEASIWSPLELGTMATNVPRGVVVGCQFGAVFIPGAEVVECDGGGFKLRERP